MQNYGIKTLLFCPKPCTGRTTVIKGMIIRDIEKQECKICRKINDTFLQDGIWIRRYTTEPYEDKFRKGTCSSMDSCIGWMRTDPLKKISTSFMQENKRLVR